MSESGIILDYRGHVDFTVIGLLLNELKKSEDFALLNKLTGKRTYAIAVECLDNIFKHSALSSYNDPDLQPYLSVRKQDDKILIIAGNPIPESKKDELIRKIDKLNNLDKAALRNFHEKIISNESINSENGAGLGLISMAIKSENRINCSFNPLINGYLCFEIQISLNK